jgi:hypothetical protein
MSTINTEVQTQPATPAIESGAEQELARLRTENAQLRQQQLESERAQRLKAAVSTTRMSGTVPTNGEQAARRQNAIAQSGGLAHWYKIPVAERVAILTDGGYVQATDKEISKYFGSKSSALEAQRLKATDSRAYRSYRATAVELGLIG